MNLNFKQLVLPLNLEVKLPDDDPVRLLDSICDELDYTELYKTYDRTWRKYDPKLLFKLIVYGYIRGYYSCRDIEKACLRDICFMWLLNGSSVPDSATIARFQNERLTPVIERLFYQFILLLHDRGEIPFENIFIDGTKIEANANKYTFVWKSAIEKFSTKLSEKSQQKLSELKQRYSIPNDFTLHQCLKHLNMLFNLYGIKFVSGKGKHKTQLQKDIEALNDYIEKDGKYSKYLGLIGTNRNSMSKTDTDATFMHLKDDHMRNGQLKPAYNIQIGVESEYIVGIGSFTERNDVRTLIPMLERIKRNTDKIYTNVIADAGYESEENYTYLNDNNQVSYIKPINYELSKTRKYKTDIFRAEHMEYREDSDEFVCSQGKELKYIHSKSSTSFNGYAIEHRVYRADDCSYCPLRDKCFSSKRNSKEIKVSLRFLGQRKKSAKNITTEQGIKLRVNRSIQVEGAFGIIKQDMGFRRFLTRGKHKTETQFFLIAFAFNLMKLQSRLENGRFNSDLFELRNTA